MFGKVPRMRQGMGLRGSESVKDSTRVNIGDKNESGERKEWCSLKSGMVQ